MKGQPMPTRVVVPLRERPLDYIWIAFFVLNLGFITYIVDLEQVLLANAPWFLVPLAMIVRMVRVEHPFTRAQGGA